MEGIRQYFCDLDFAVKGQIIYYLVIVYPPLSLFEATLNFADA